MVNIAWTDVWSKNKFWRTTRVGVVECRLVGRTADGSLNRS